jgi:macrodomain Ter protein organizer (MatP/YcbG family)
LILEGKWNMQLVGMVDMEKAICQGQLRNKKEDKKHSKKKNLQIDFMLTQKLGIVASIELTSAV